MDLEGSIIANIPFEKLAANVKQNLGNSKKEWDKHVVDFSKAHQLRWKPNIGSALDICSSTTSLSLTYERHPSFFNTTVRTIVTDERKYYQSVMEYSKTTLMVSLHAVLPYHQASAMYRCIRIISAM